jgi:hypothetical protein
MESFSDLMAEYQHQMQLGVIPRAYRGLMDYLLELRSRLASAHPDYIVSGSLYFGYMDMTYFAFTSPALTEKKLKVAIVYVHQTGRFEIWLAAANRPLQARYWKLFRESGYTQYRVLDDLRGEDAIVVHTLADAPDFSDLPTLTSWIESESLRFIRDMEEFLSSTE